LRLLQGNKIARLARILILQTVGKESWEEKGGWTGLKGVMTINEEAYTSDVVLYNTV
jgi:hypothetical protein